MRSRSDRFEKERHNHIYLRNLVLVMPRWEAGKAGSGKTLSVQVYPGRLISGRQGTGHPPLPEATTFIN